MGRQENRDGIFYTVLLALAASFLYMTGSGIRNNFGVMLSGIVENTGIPFASVSFVLAVSQFCFGVTQPMFGVLAERRGSRLALLLGILSTLAGLLLLPLCKTQLSLMLVLGILLPGGSGALSFGILMGAISARIPEKRNTVVSGIVNASSGIGNTLMTPLISFSIAAGGLLCSMEILAGMTALMLPVLFWMCGKVGKAEKVEKVEKAAEKPEAGRKGGFRLALKSRDYLFIMAGFFTCGFHMAIITNHLPTEILSFGHSNEQMSFAFSIYGVATLLGCLASGGLCARLRQKDVLGALYGSRSVMVVLFLLLPKTLPVICGFVFLLGFTGSATLTPVLGICRKLFGEGRAAVFFSLAFLIHQVGGFCSAWFAGECFAAAGSYTAIWLADILLAGVAAAASWLIREKAVF